MLVLSRKINQSILIADNITVTVTRINSSEVRLAIKAPDSMPIFRTELLVDGAGRGTRRDTHEEEDE